LRFLAELALVSSQCLRSRGGATKTPPLRIGLSARLIRGRGRIEQSVIGLASGLSKAADDEKARIYERTMGER